MSKPTDIERVSQNRVVKLFKEELSYTYLGDWEKREGNSNIEEEYLINYLERKGYSEEHISKAIFELQQVATNFSDSLYTTNKNVYSKILLKMPMVTTNLLWKMILASVVMLVTGYMGEAGLGNATVWGTVSALAYFYIVYEVWLGDVKKLATSAGSAVASANKALGWFILVGWAIYPLGYLIGTAEGQWYAGFANIGLDMDIVYNIGDAVNKIGFGLVIYALSRKAA